MLKLDRTEEVYQCIWNYVTTNEALPTIDQIHATLRMPKDEIRFCLKRLREDGKLETRLLLPTAYCAWWREHIRARWSYKALRESRA